MAEAVFTGPMIVLGGQSFADAPDRSRAVLGMDLFLPKPDILARGGAVKTKQGFKTLRPGKCAGSYIPIPNSIIRSPGKDRKMFRALKRAAFRNFRASFMFLSEIPGVWMFALLWLWRGVFGSLNFGR